MNITAALYGWFARRGRGPGAPQPWWRDRKPYAWLLVAALFLVLGMISLGTFAGTPRGVESLPVSASLHICGRAGHLVELMCKTGAVGLSLDSPTDITKIKDKVPPDIMIMGNLAPVEVLMMKVS